MKDRNNPTLVLDLQRKEKTAGDVFWIKQGFLTNGLLQINTKGYTATVTIKKSVGEIMINRGNLSVTLPQELRDGLTPTTHRLLQAIMHKFTDDGARTPEVRLYLSDYMRMCGLKDRKETIRQVDYTLRLFREIKITYEDKVKLRDSNFCNETGWNKDKGKKNEIVLVFSSKIFEILKTYPAAPYPALLLKLNQHKNPNSFYFLSKIVAHRSMNKGKSNENLISVKALIESSPVLPSYTAVRMTDQHVIQRIIKPFERDLDALSHCLTWEHFHPGGIPLTEEERANLSWEIFRKLIVKTSWKS